MAIKDTLANIFANIAKKLGYTINKVKETDIDFNEEGFNPTAIGASIIAGIAIDDSEIKVEGNNARAEKLRELVEEYNGTVRDVNADVCLGKGGSIVRPYTEDGVHIAFNVIDSDNYRVTSSIGRTLNGVIMKLDEYETDKAVYMLCEAQEYADGVCHIRRMAFKGENEIPLTDTTWSGIEEQIDIEASQVLLGWYRCPTINRDDVNSIDGVPITYGCKGMIDTLNKRIEQYDSEFDKKQAKTIVSQEMLKTEKGKDGVTRQTLGDEQVFLNVKNGLNSSVNEMIHDYSPDIRDNSFQAGIENKLRLIEMACGFSTGVFTHSETSFATATEIKNTRLKTFQFVKKFRRNLEYGDRMLLNALDVMLNANNITPQGDWDVSFDWSYGYIQESRERFTQLLQGHSAGVVSDEDLSAWILNLDDEEKQKYMDELRAEQDERAEAMRKQIEQ